MSNAILGVDPGLGATGFGVVEAEAARLRVLEAGDIRSSSKDPLAVRLEAIHSRLAALLMRWQPRALVLEKVYTHYEHSTTASMMAHARGVACLAAEQQGVELVEYPSTRVKKCVTGNGHASKRQVAGMVERLVGHSDPSWSFDATDALALAIAHAQMEGQHRKSELLNLGRRRKHS